MLLVAGHMTAIIAAQSTWKSAYPNHIAGIDATKSVN